MRISQVEAIHLRLPEVKEVADGTQDCLLVRIHTDAGITGLGEVVSCSYVSRAVIEAPRSAPFRHGLGAIVQGMDPLDPGIAATMEEGTAWYGPGGVARHAMSGIDMAIWDIRGKMEGLPVRRLLDAGAVDVVPCYASVLWPDRPDQVAASATDFLEQGYGAVKYGWGPMGPDASLDEELVAAARDALGPGVHLMVDAGRAWEAETALSRAELFAPYDVLWLEEPLQPRDFAGYGRLTGSSAVPVAAGEALALPGEYASLLDEGGIHIVQPDLGRIAGITAARDLAAMSQRAGARAVPHAFGTGVLLAASANWAAVAPDPLTEYTRAPSPLARDLVRHTMTLDRGTLRLSEAPGLGVDLDEEVVAKYRVA